MKFARIYLHISRIIPILVFARGTPPTVPDVITCHFKVQAVLNYPVVYKRYDSKVGAEPSFSFKLAGLSRGKPLISEEFY